MNMNKIVAALGIIAGSAFVAQSAVAQAVKVDPALPTYQKASGVSGNFTSVGSDTLNNLMTLWAEATSATTPTSTSRSRAPVPRPRPQR
jgi:phosphate transport system substrate-binding protein